LLEPSIMRLAGWLHGLAWGSGSESFQVGIARDVLATPLPVQPASRTYHWQDDHDDDVSGGTVTMTGISSFTSCHGEYEFKPC
jgi:hypothetical protein